RRGQCRRRSAQASPPPAPNARQRLRAVCASRAATSPSVEWWARQDFICRPDSIVLSITWRLTQLRLLCTLLCTGKPPGSFEKNTFAPLVNVTDVWVGRVILLQGD